MTVAAPGLRYHPVRKPLAALLAGAVVALLAGLIGLGGAQSRLVLAGILLMSALKLWRGAGMSRAQ